MIKLHSLDKHPDIHQGFLSSQSAKSRIVISQFGQGVSYFYNNTRLFNTHNALLLFEKAYSPVLYVPKSDIFQRHFLPGTNTSYCPYKGEANYWSVCDNDKIIVDAAWEYSEPKSDVEIIENHVAFANHQNGGQYLIYDI